MQVTTTMLGGYHRGCRTSATNICQLKQTTVELCEQVGAIFME